MRDQIKAIDERMPGQFGVYIKRPATGEAIDYQADRDWYLASTIKIPLAVAVMQRAEEGELSLDDELELAESDYVDGAGELLAAEPGTRYSLEELIGHSIRDSDSSSTDMLIRLLGEESFNDQVSREMPEARMNPITTIVQVRFDAYANVHPDAETLTNMDFIRLRSAASLDERYHAFLDKIGAGASEANADSLEEAFGRYYETGLNSGPLTGFGAMLERLWEGELLNEDHTGRLMAQMEQVTTGDRRIRAGLPDGTPYAQKTGTQINRACDVGIIHPEDPERTTIVAACAEDYGDLRHAEEAFQALGRLLAEQ
ncbi:serine hydrolase [Aquisalimonas asiatica]|nr:serine hydrolase [Aquisalimonas asiatica]